MDTNLVATLVTALAANNVPKTASGDTTILIVGMVIAAALQILASILTYLKANASMANTADAKATALATADSVEKVHIAVNSERTAMLEQVKQLRDQILQLSQDKVVLQEHQRGVEVASAIAAQDSIVTTKLAQVAAAATVKATTPPTP